MKKILAIAVAIVMFSQPVAASAGSLKAGNAISVTYPSSVKLVNGCQIIKVSYKVGSMTGLDFGFFSIYDDADQIIAQQIIYKSPEFAKYKGEKVSKKIGTAKIKVCRDGWSEDLGDDEYEDHPAFSKGTYQVGIGTRNVDEKIGYIKFY